MDTRHPFKVGEGGRRGIFFGVPAMLCAVLMCTGEQVAGIVGERAWPYVIYGFGAVFAVGGMLLYNHVPRRLVIPLGIAGWIFSFSLIYWFILFGPGALGHR